MDFRKHLFILKTIEGLRESRSWTGRTHVQKTLFLVESALQVPVPFQFVLYKHGPYSFEIEEELEQMKSYAAVLSFPMQEYGVILKPGPMADFVIRTSPLSSAEENGIRRVCEFIDGRGVAELEKLATAAWIRSREGLVAPEMIAQRLHSLKPHISVQAARSADDQLAGLLPAGSSSLAGPSGSERAPK